MTPKFSYSTASGSYSFEVSSNVVMCTFNGACCDQIAQRYLATLCKIVSDFNGEPWAYLGNAQLHLAATPQAEQYLLECFVMSVKNNCIGDAYCLTSAVGISQLKSIRQKAGLTATLEERMFGSQQSAFSQLTKELKQYSAVENSQEK
ncbi:hypothetical protein [Paraglaciecola sp. T6c]|uniref:hypothetical protein n=1 Tax=Pseudoalteromonas atlantica (strain T6c / ATCC BAA-1087) TaxID=3042615 RepID=UPI00005C58E0|nr:hypothetical protein [Paraglaciecola sp. T6c]